MGRPINFYLERNNMKSWNLTIAIPGETCDKGCPYCISQITGMVITNQGLIDNNVKFVKNFARCAGAAVCTLTGKREPFLNYGAIIKMAKAFWPMLIEIQTNGIWLNKNQDRIPQLFTSGVRVVAFSVDTLETIDEYKELFIALDKKGIVVRVCINLTDMIVGDFVTIFEMVKESPVRQFLIRNVTFPGNARKCSQVTWIKAHVDSERYREMAYKFEENQVRLGKKPHTVLPYGMKIWEKDGISIAFSDYCIQEENNTSDVRSLVWLPDGHLYTGWGNRATIIF